MRELALGHPAFAINASEPWYGAVTGAIGALFYVGLPIAGVIYYTVVRPRHRRKAAQFDGTALTGTAQVLSAARGGGLAGVLAAGRAGVMCRFGLRVEIPGRQPYDATVTTLVSSPTLAAVCVDGQRWEPGRPWHVKLGTTVAVQVDSANPEKVQIDFSQPITHQPGSPYSPPAQYRSWFDYSDMSPGYRMLMIAWWVVSVGGILTVLTMLMTR